VIYDFLGRYFMDSSSANENRRRTRRQLSKSSTKVTCHKGAWGLGPNLARRLLDLSTDGARLVVAAPLERGHEVTLQMEALWHQRPIKMQAQVRGCEALADGDYCVGVHFEKTLGYHEVQVLAASGT
jgi:hypothetical protein